MPTDRQIALAALRQETVAGLSCHCYSSDLVWDIVGGEGQFHWRGKDVKLGIIQCRHCGYGIIFMQDPSRASYWQGADIQILYTAVMPGALMFGGPAWAHQ